MDGQIKMDVDENECLFSQPCNRSWSNGLQQLAPRQLTLKGAPFPFQAGAKFIQNTECQCWCPQIHLSKMILLFVLTFLGFAHLGFFASFSFAEVCQLLAICLISFCCLLSCVLRVDLLFSFLLICVVLFWSISYLKLGSIRIL